MTRSEVYNALRMWLQSHGFDVGYRVQKRSWNELEGTEGERYLVIQQNGGGTPEEAITRDFFASLFCQNRTTAILTKLKTALMQSARR